MDGSSARHTLRWKQICAGALSAASLIAGHLVFGQEAAPVRRPATANETLAPILDARSRPKPSSSPSVPHRPAGDSLPPIISGSKLPKPTAAEATFVPLNAKPAAIADERKPVAILELTPSRAESTVAKPSAVSPWMMDIQDAITEKGTTPSKSEPASEEPKTTARQSTEAAVVSEKKPATSATAYPMAQLGVPQPSSMSTQTIQAGSPPVGRSAADLRKPSTSFSKPVITTGVAPAPQSNPFIKPPTNTESAAAPVAKPEAAAKSAAKPEAEQPQAKASAPSAASVAASESAYPLPAIDADPTESIAAAAPQQAVEAKTSLDNPAERLPKWDAPRTPSLTAPVENHFATRRETSEKESTTASLPPVVAPSTTAKPSTNRDYARAVSGVAEANSAPTTEAPTHTASPFQEPSASKAAARMVENAHHERPSTATERMQLTGYETQERALSGQPGLAIEAAPTGAATERPISQQAKTIARSRSHFTQAEAAADAPRPLPGPTAGPFQMIGDSGTVSVMVRRSMLLRTETDIYRTAVVDPAICDVIQFTPREISIIGKSQGSTHVTFWFEGPNATPVTYLVKVEPDAAEVKKEEDKYKLLEDVINEMFPDSKVQLLLVADKLIVKGQAKDSEQATQIMSIIRSNAGGGGGGAWGPGGWNGGAGGGLSEGIAADVLSDSATGAAARGRYQVINMLRVPGVQQVALRVKIAELNRTAARGFGVDVHGNVSFSDSPEGTDLFFNSILNVAGGGAPALLAQFDGDDISVGIRYLQQQGVIRLLSEPTLVTMSGRPATFVAGGEFAVPTVVGTAGLNAVTTDFRAFGAIISFLPTVVDKDRIRLEVSPEFSQINQELAVNGTPGLKTRAVTTTVEMREGQTFAIAGLLEDNMNGTTIGDLPFLAHIFGRRSMQRAETELIILVTPELVHPMEAEEVPPLPGFDVTEPDNCQFFLGGKIEGTPTREYRSTVWPRLKNRYKAGGPAMTSGPFGHGQ